jgi:hypothetical protein
MPFITFMQSTAGRVLRGVAGLCLIAYGMTHGSLSGVVLTIVGVVPLITALAGICPMELAVHGRRRAAGQQVERGAS